MDVLSAVEYIVLHLCLRKRQGAPQPWGIFWEGYPGDLFGIGIRRTLLFFSTSIPTASFRQNSGQGILIFLVFFGIQIQRLCFLSFYFPDGIWIDRGVPAPFFHRYSYFLFPIQKRKRKKKGIYRNDVLNKKKITDVKSRTAMSVSGKVNR